MLYKIFFFLIALLPGSLFAAHVAVLETISPQGVLDVSDRQYLTDELRAQAVRALPAELNFTIMTRENIIAMLPPGKSIEQCEGSCLVETGKNISADYVAQGRVGKFGNKLTLTVELYETAGAKLVGSFTSESGDADGLLASVREKAPGLFAKARGAGPGFAGQSGISDVSSGAGFDLGGNRMYIVKVQTVPAGAALSVDGRPTTKCKATPCNVQVAGGEHRFLAALDYYDDKDTVLTVSQNGLVLNLPLMANFGTFALYPKFMNNYGTPLDLQIKIDGNSAHTGERRLDPGTHSVEITHPCYEPLKFDVSIAKGGKVRFDSTLTPAVGGLSLDAEANGEPQIVPVWVDGRDVGNTPYLGEVPLCAVIQAGAERAPVSVKLKYHETVEHTAHVAAGKVEPIVESVTTAADDSLQLDPDDSAAVDERDDSADAAAEAVNENDSGKHIKVVPIVLMSLGVVALAGGVYEYVQGSKARDDYDALDYSTKRSEADAQWRKVQDAKWREFGFYGVGAALLAAGIVWTVAF